MAGRTRGALKTLALVTALLTARAAADTPAAFAPDTPRSFAAAAGRAQNPSRKARPAGGESAPAASPCAVALRQGAVCEAANRRALELMDRQRLEAFVVVQDVRTGGLVAFAASRPSELDVTTPVLPLSVAKLFLSASWWDQGQPEASFVSTKGSPTSKNPAYRSRVSVHEMLVGGSDSAGREMAVALRKSAGAGAVLEDLRRYGLGPQGGAALDESFWAELAPAWRGRLTPAASHATLGAGAGDAEWGDVLSIGESRLSVTGLHVSRFLQAVGHGGLMLPPFAREARQASSDPGAGASGGRPGKAVRVMRESTALRLQAAMLDTVRRGTAKGAAEVLEGTGWRVGGKTGTGPGPAPIGPQSDGWFAGLIFDSRGRARFTVATYVRRGGPGGGNAARLSAELARYLAGGRRR
jgi:cell division protein FtsI/penicillin-binding protein 2